MCFKASLLKSYYSARTSNKSTSAPKFCTPRKIKSKHGFKKSLSMIRLTSSQYLCSPGSYLNGLMR